MNDAPVSQHKDLSERALGAVLLAPAALLLLVIVVYPIATLFWNSLHSVDPNNPQLIYQRFQNGILMFNATTRSTTALPMGEYLKSVLTGRDVPMDLAQATAASPLFGQLALSRGAAEKPDGPQA